MKFTKSSKSNVSFTSNSRKSCPISAIKYALICMFFVFSFKSFAQKYFNDTLHFNSDNTTLLSMTLPTDSGIYVTCQKYMDSTGLSAAYVLIGFIDALGDSHIIYDSYDPNNHQIIAGSQYKLFTNTLGNFVLAYSNAENDWEYPRIKEVSPQGQLLRDIKLDTIKLLGDSGIAVFDFTRLYQHKDSSYWLWSISSFLKADPPIQQKVGPLLTILDKNFHVDTIIRYYFDPQKKWNYYFADEVELDSGKVAVLIGAELRLTPIGNSEDVYLMLLILDNNGTILSQDIYNLPTSTVASSGSLTRSIENDGYIIPTWICEEINDTFIYRGYIAKYTQNLQPIWKTQTAYFNENTLYLGAGPKRIITTTDSNYVFLSANYPFNGNRSQTAMRIHKVSPTGEILWQRDFWYFTVPETGFDGNYHDMTDVRECPDGGFVFPGTITGNTFQVGWLVKTNCLGFLGPPEVAFAYKNSKTADSTYFYNTSVQAGSYFWDFGDGTTLNTDEYADTLVHQYSDTGSYNITLIGYGCNGEADTLRYEVHVTPPPIKDSTITQVGDGYFTFFPNPVQTGSALYVYLNGALEHNASTIELNFYSSAGKIVQNTSISSKKGYYTISNTLSSGLYFVHLTQNGNNIAVKKLVVM